MSEQSNQSNNRQNELENEQARNHGNETISATDDKEKCGCFMDRYGWKKIFNRKILILSAVVVVLMFILVWPVIIGRTIENKFQNMVSKLKESLQDRIEVVSNYQRGYFTSESSLELKVLRKDAAPIIQVNSKISHFGMSASSDITFNNEFHKIFFTSMEASPQVKVDSSLKINGQLSNHFEIAPIKIKATGLDEKKEKIAELVANHANSARLEIAGLKGEINLSSDLELKLLEVRSNDISAFKNSATSNTGSTANAASSMVAGLSESRNYMLQNSSLILKLNTSKEVFNGNLNLFFDKYLDEDSKEWGPGNLEFAVQNFSLEILDGFKKIIADLKSYDGSEASAEDLRIKFLGRSMTILPAFIKHSPKIELKNLKLKTEKGDLLGSAAITIPNNGAGIFSFLTAMSVQIDLKGPEFLVQNLATRYYLFSKKFKESKESVEGKENAPTVSGREEASKKDDSKEIMGGNSGLGNGDLMEQKAKEEARQLAIAALEGSYKNKYLIKNGEEVSFSFEYKDSAMKLNNSPFYFPMKQ